MSEISDMSLLSFTDLLEYVGARTGLSILKMIIFN